ncbi:MAG: response regulator [Candidatus Cloacimonadales bacterium]
MNKELTCKELCDKLDISLNTIKIYSDFLHIPSGTKVSNSLLLNKKQIKTIIEIAGYVKLGYDQAIIREELAASLADQKDVSCFIFTDVLKLVPVLFISNDENNETVIKNNSLTPSLDEFLNSKKNISIREVATKFKINEQDIAEIVKDAELCKQSGEKKINYAHGIAENRFYHIRVTTIRSTNSDNSYFLTTIFRDFTEEYMTRKNISDNNFGLHKTLERIPFPLLILDNDKIVYFNNHVQHQFKNENISNYTFSSLLFSLSNNHEFVSDVLAKKQQFILSNEHTRHIDKIDFSIKNKYFIFNLSFSKIDNNLILVGFSDITEKEEHLGNLMNERSLFENGPVMIVKYIDTKQGKQIEWVSENVKHFTGLTKEEITANNIDLNTFVSEEMLPQLYDEADAFYAKKQEYYSHSPYKIIRKDKSEIWVKDHTRLLFDANKNYVGYLEYLIDVSDMKAFEEDLKQAKENAEDANRAKSTFLSHMSHEIRTPLNAINGFSQLIYDIEKDLDKREKLKTIVQSGNHLLDIINNILELSKIEAGNIKIQQAEFSLKSVVDEVQRIVSVSANNKGLEFEIVKSLIIPDRVIGDEIQIKQILINLLSNAVNYTERGKIILELKYQNNHATFIVKDTGIGIRKQEMEAIFNAFEQIRSGDKKVTYGTGLGLSIVKKIVDAMKGEIKVDSRINNGSRFEVTILLPKGKEVTPIQKVTRIHFSSNYDFSHLKILVAEDNAINQKLISSILKRVHNICDIAKDGQVALDMLDQKEYDILLLDIQMPVMDGMEALKHIRTDNKHKNLPIIALTAFAMAEERDKYIAAGCDDFVAKPINKLELYEKIDSLCTKD